MSKRMGCEFTRFIIMLFSSRHTSRFDSYPLMIFTQFRSSLKTRTQTTWLSSPHHPLQNVHHRRIVLADLLQHQRNDGEILEGTVLRSPTVGKNDSTPLGRLLDRPLRILAEGDHRGQQRPTRDAAQQPPSCQCSPAASRRCPVPSTAPCSLRHCNVGRTR